jgi:hypothetical protein
VVIAVDASLMENHQGDGVQPRLMNGGGRIWLRPASTCEADVDARALPITFRSDESSAPLTDLPSTFSS